MSIDTLVADIDDQIKRLTAARVALVPATKSASAVFTVPVVPAAPVTKTASKLRRRKMTQQQKDHMSQVMKDRWAASKKAAKKAAKKSTKVAGA